MGSLFGDDSSLHGSTLFGSEPISRGSADVVPDPWSGTSSTPFVQTVSSVSTLLSGANIPEIYGIAFDDAISQQVASNPSASRDSVSVSALNTFFTQISLPQGVRTKIYSLINVPPYDPNLAPESSPKINRGTWNVAVALAAFAQKGSSEDNLSLSLVDFSRNSLPHIAVAKYQSQLYRTEDSLSGNRSLSSAPFTGSYPFGSPSKSKRTASTSDLAGANLGPSPPNGSLMGTTWQSPVDPSNYNPLAPNTISVSLVPKREGTLFFRHVNYIVEGDLPNSIVGKASGFQSSNGTSGATHFKVTRRYSDFDWLLEALQKKYPFRLLPNLPPKRLTDGRYLSSDTHFLERRRRGLQRFLNLLVKHPLLKHERLVSIFFSVETELSIWRSSGATLDLYEEYHNRVIAPDFVASWDEAARQEHWRNVRHSAEAARDTLTQLSKLSDRVSRRNMAMAQDLGAISNILSAFNQTIPLLYQSGGNSSNRFGDAETEGDLPGIRESVQNVSKYMTKSSSILLDEGSSLEVGLVEDVKILKDTVLSVIEMFARYDKFGGDTVQFLERRVKQNEIKLSNNAAFSQGNADIKASEREKLLKSIDADKRTIEFQKNRSWLIRQTIAEELQLHQRTQYLVTKLLRDWANTESKFSDLQSENWTALTRDIVVETPLT